MKNICKKKKKKKKKHMEPFLGSFLMQVENRSIFCRERTGVDDLRKKKGGGLISDYFHILITRLSFCTLFKRMSPCLMVA